MGSPRKTWIPQTAANGTPLRDSTSIHVQDTQADFFKTNGHNYILSVRSNCIQPMNPPMTFNTKSVSSESPRIAAVKTSTTELQKTSGAEEPVSHLLLCDCLVVVSLCI